MAFHHGYKRLGVEKADELRIAGLDRGAGAVILEGKGGGIVPWAAGSCRGRQTAWPLEPGVSRFTAPIRWSCARAIRNCATSTAPGPPPCMRFRAVPSIP